MSSGRVLILFRKQNNFYDSYILPRGFKEHAFFVISVSS